MTNVRSMLCCENLIYTSRHFQTVNDSSKLERAERKTPEADSDLDEDPENEQKRPVLESELEFAHMGPADQDYPSSEGAVDIPDRSAVDTESSDGHDLGFQVESDGDHEKDEDYLMESDHSDDDDKGSNSDIYVREVLEHPKKPGKVKTAKVSSVSKPLVNTTLKLTRTKKNPSEATFAKQSTMYAITQPSQETLLLIQLPK
jgi:hypothetical protein